MAVRPDHFASIRVSLDTLQKWDTKRGREVRMVLDGTYIDLPEDLQGLLETIRENLCRRKINEQRANLKLFDIDVEMDFALDV